ncbi:hypothetical protein [Citrobacter sp. RHBSTW-00271]|uniref:hypothetical protein n=1 Tax=Citrobacter sp. RHBSTW-00271 TaxID=2742642 RepID=UPI0015F8BA34|nr:hypothetical protein [Citrobacter sp. RHBSTW-00271]MBA7944159.1 hypothetical protein [Citrobacter sp. RHBSTW-00271]
MSIMSVILFFTVIYILLRSGFLLGNVSISNEFVNVPVKVTIMLAFSICVMHVSVQFINGTIASYIAGFALLILAIWSYFTKYKKRTMFVFTIVLAFLIVLPRIYGLFIVKDFVPLEGTGNHDELWYIFRALRLQDFTISSRASSSTFDYIASSTSVTFDLLPRIGSELLLVFFSRLTRFEVYQIYPLVFALGALLLAGTVCAFISVQKNSRYSLLFAGLIVSLSPAMLYIWANGNYATLWGLNFFGLGYYFYTKSLSSAKYDVNCLITAILFAALLSTYPELLSIAIPSILIFIFFHLYLHKSFMHVMKLNLLIVFLIVCFAPFGTYDVINTFITTSNAVSEGGSLYTGLFELLNVYNGLYFITTLYIAGCEHLYQKLFLMFYSFSVVYALFKIDINSKKIIFPVSCSSFLILGIMYAKGYPYGVIKAVEFISFPISVILFCFVYRSVYAFKRNLSSCIDVVVVLILMCGVGYSFSKTINEYIHVSSVKHLSQDIVSLNGALANFKDNVLLVEDNLGDYSFMNSRWIGYFLNGQKIIFSPSLQNGGYLYNLQNNYEKYKDKVSLKLLLVKNISSNDFILYKNDTYAIKRVSRDYHETWRGRIGENARIKFTATCPRIVNLNAARRFEGIGSNNEIHIQTTD